MGKYVECQNCQEQYDCERTYLGGCTDGKEWEEKTLLSKSDKEFYFALMTNCKKVIEKCPNIEERRLACEYCRFEQVRKKAVEEYERKIEDGELVSKDWHDEQVLHAENEIEELKKDYIELDLECRELRTELDKELAEHEEFTKKAKEEIERLTEYNANLNGMCLEFTDKNAELQKQVDGLKNAYNDLLDTCRNCDTTQAVKDTAKEILLLSKDTPTYWDFVQAVKEKYSVEVE